MGEADDRHVPHHLPEDRVAPAAQVRARADHARQRAHDGAQHLGHPALERRSMRAPHRAHARPTTTTQ
ncbi:hypothetical protein, partial [Burkholderia pseudomallei]|uniref:hypothetical protein n=1 Tax=Burkholderia pseudomallei TaxID=28450 RepID=UPI001CA55D13